MSEILVIAEHRDGSVLEASRQVIAAVSAVLGRPSVTAAVVASDPSAFVPSLSIDRVETILGVRVDVPTFDSGAVSRALEPIIRERRPSLVVAAQTVTAANFGPRLAVKLGTGFAGNVVGIHPENDSFVASRDVLGGKARTEVRLGSGSIVLLRADAFAGEIRPGAPAYSETNASLSTPDLPSIHVAFEAVPASEDDLTRASVIVTVGRGVPERDDIELFERLARKLDAALGSTRPLVDAGWLPRSRQVGQSGATVKPRVYLAFGVSGANEHLAGMRGSGTIVAVNTDRRAPIFDVAQFGAVADAVEVAEALDELM